MIFCMEQEGFPLLEVWNFTENIKYKSKVHVYMVTERYSLLSYVART